MRKIAIKHALASAAALAALAGASLALDTRGAAAQQAGGVYINAIDLVIAPPALPKFLDAIKENAAASAKEPGVREFNVTALNGNPNHVFLYEVYENEAALETHRQTAHFKKFQAATQGMVVDRLVRPMSVVAMNAKTQPAGGFINGVDLVIDPAQLAKFQEAIRENGANSVKEPGVREFNITALANNPNHVFLYEVYENEAALDAHRQTAHYKKYQAATQGLVIDRGLRQMSAVALNANSKGQ